MPEIYFPAANRFTLQQRARRAAGALLGRPTPMVSAAMDLYADRFSSPESALLGAVAADTRLRTGQPAMMSDARQGHLLATLVRLGAARNILEIGTFTGYSALAMAEAMPADGRLVTCEVDPVNAGIAAGHFSSSPFADLIDLRVGPALDTIASLDTSFDLIFIDADKAGYIDYFRATLPKLEPAGVMVVDNTLHDSLHPQDDGDREMIRSIEEFNAFVRDDPRVDQVILTVRDGVTLIRHRVGADTLRG